MPGPYRRLDVANVNQHVVTATPEKAKKATKKAAVSDDKDAAASKSDTAS